MGTQSWSGILQCDNEDVKASMPDDNLEGIGGECFVGLFVIPKTCPIRVNLNTYVPDLGAGKAGMCPGPGPPHFGGPNKNFIVVYMYLMFGLTE